MTTEESFDLGNDGLDGLSPVAPPVQQHPRWVRVVAFVVEGLLTLTVTTLFVFCLSLISGIAVSFGEALAAAWLIAVLMKPR